VIIYFAAKVPIPNGIINSLSKPSKQLVQWDGIIAATKNKKKMLFLIEAKEISNANDIFNGRNGDDGIYPRGLRTLEYLKSLKGVLSKGVRYSEDIKIQHTIFRAYLDYDISIVYASGLMNSNVMKEIQSV
jgi:hypothetical protein